MPDLFGGEGEFEATGFELPGDPTEPAPEGTTAVAEPAATPEPAVEPVDNSSERARDENGRFVAKEAAEEPAAAEVPAADAEELILGKFKSYDDLIRSYQHLESKQGSSGSELAEMRQQLAQMQELMEAQAQAPQQQAQMIDAAAYEDEIDQNPAGWAQWAVENGQAHIYERAVQQWAQDDPLAASRFDSQLRERKLREELQAQVQQVAAPIQNMTAQQAQQAAYRQFAEAHPDVDKFADQMAEIAQGSKVIFTALKSDDHDTRVEALEYLYNQARGRSSDNLGTAAQELARAQAEESARARQEATVASGTAHVDAEKPSPAQQIAAQWDNFDKPYNDGWNV